MTGIAIAVKEITMNKRYKLARKSDSEIRPRKGIVRSGRDKGGGGGSSALEEKKHPYCLIYTPPKACAPILVVAEMLCLSTGLWTRLHRKVESSRAMSMDP